MTPIPWNDLDAVTIDLWGTILHQQDPQEKIERRRAILLGVLRDAGHPLEVEELRGGFRRSRAIIDAEIAATHRDIGPVARWDILMAELGVAPGRIPFSAVAHAYDDLVVEFLPPLMPDLASTLDRLAARYRLALICNTGYTGGDVLRKVLSRHGMDRHFDALTFSNELGLMKPHPAIFEHTLSRLDVDPGRTLHIGDTEHQDIAGAIGFGMFAVRFAPPPESSTRAHLAVESWGELAGHLPPV
jgi:putative hydrolase of the HAD superfamily